MIWRLVDGMAFRVGVLLTLAFLPIGLIAASLANQVNDQMSRRNETALLGITLQASSKEQNLIRVAVGAGRAFAAQIASESVLPTNCSDPFINFSAENPAFSFVGYVASDGRVTCGSTGVGTDLSDQPITQSTARNPVEGANVSLDAPVSKTAVIAITIPVLKEGKYGGFVAMSLPHSGLIERPFASDDAVQNLDLITFNEVGTILTTTGDFATAPATLPSGEPLSSLISRSGTAFTQRTPSGEIRSFAVTTILEGKVFAIGSLPVKQFGGLTSAGTLSPLIFPALMWLVSLGVAYFAVHRLALNHISRIRRDMERFTLSRRRGDTRADFSTPLEIREIEQTWRGLADTILREEAELVNVILDKNVLLKEVHHRVKNNLQLINSIVNMKARRATSPEARHALKEVQMRVMSIAIVHRALYETSTESQVSANEVLETVINESIDSSIDASWDIDVRLDLNPIVLYPDQAVPLALLAAETSINAAKFVGKNDKGRPFIMASLKAHGKNGAIFEMRNSTGTHLNPDVNIQGTRLGKNLIAAFAQQLNGEFQTIEENGTYIFSVSFDIAGFTEAPQDSTIPPGHY